jgi:multidrug transporter EmrE-like cation transporter
LFTENFAIVIIRGEIIVPRLLLLLSVVFAASGQVLFKMGMNTFKDLSFAGGVGNLLKTLVSVVFSPIVFSGLVLYVLSTVLWLVALSKTALNVAYPFTALTFILVMTASYFLFQEEMLVNRIIGGGVILVGIVIISLK